MKEEKQNKTYTVSHEFLMKCHDKACSDWKTRLEAEFPEAFIEENDMFEFGNTTDPGEVTVSTSSRTNHKGQDLPIIIGLGVVKQDYKGRCFVVKDTTYFPEIVHDKSITGTKHPVVVFRKKPAK